MERPPIPVHEAKPTETHPEPNTPAKWPVPSSPKPEIHPEVQEEDRLAERHQNHAPPPPETPARPA